MIVGLLIFLQADCDNFDLSFQNMTFSLGEKVRWVYGGNHYLLIPKVRIFHFK